MRDQEEKLGSSENNPTPEEIREKCDAFLAKDTPEQREARARKAGALRRVAWMPQVVPVFAILDEPFNSMEDDAARYIE